ncbi:unnamed protein product [Tuber aestivum]|uniref:Uncharacterized protein n=1 Tax=Tuber aestivum TaxID=59557 RepID=A0A292PT68_9PEZI|nr:unnamed protein product [Tuber aestivum]
MEPTTATTVNGNIQRTPPPSPPASIDTDAKMAIYTSTSTLFSPLKRKRESLPPPPLQAGWLEEGEGVGGGRGREPEGSLHSGRLARQLEGLSLGRVKFPFGAEMACGDGAVVDGDDRDEGGEEEEEAGDEQVVGKRTRLVSPPLTLGRGGGCGSSSDEEAGNAPAPHSMQGRREGAAEGGEEEEEEEEEDSDWGLSGVGVKPSARQSYIRAQKKLQQIREYKTRVSKEAREKRSWERRRRKSFTNTNSGSATVAAVTKGLAHRSEGEEDEEGCRRRRKRVHFDI